MGRVKELNAISSLENSIERASSDMMKYQDMILIRIQSGNHERSAYSDQD